MLLAAMLLSLEILVSDFAGWGSAYPTAWEAARRAFGPDDDAPMEWLDYYLPRRAELEADLVKVFGPLQ